MKRIILLRHAKTEPYNYNKEDFKRNLTERGIADCHIISQKLKDNNIIPDCIISSPANRTTQTSEFFAENFNYDPNNIVYKQKIYEGMGTSEFDKIFSKINDQIETVLFVGHNPDIARFAYHLSNSFENIVPTCTAIVFNVDIDSWSEMSSEKCNLEKVFIPKDYKNHN